MAMLDVFDKLQPVGWMGLVTTSAAALTLVYRIGRFVTRVLIQTAEFLDDWRGEDQRPGVAARPGVMQRLSQVEGQLSTNGGTSLKDQTNRIEVTLDRLTAEYTEHVRSSGPGDHH